MIVLTSPTIQLLSLVTIITLGSSTCFDNSYLPKTLINSSADDNSGYYSVAATDDALFVGGVTDDSKLRGPIAFRSSVVTRFQLDTFSTVWSMIYQANNDECGSVTALKLDPT